MIERKFETLLTQYGKAMQNLAACNPADHGHVAAKAVRAKAILRSFLKDELEAARATAEQSTFALQALVAAGHVSQAKVDEALSIAAATPGIRAAEQSRDSVIEECAMIVEQHQETFTTMSGGEEERHLTTRRHGNQMGMAYANAIRALKSQQDAAIESKPAEQSQSDAWISVDERLPKACTEVLVWRIDSGPFIAQLVAPCDVPDADDESDDLRWLADAYGWQEGSEKPTYWKPLPEGPIVESQLSGDGS